MIYVWCVIKIFLINPLIWLLKHRVALVGVMILVVGLFAYQSCNRPEPSKPGVTQTLTVQQQKAPPITDAPTVFQTYSRVYYVAKYAQPNPDKVILYSWYEWQKNKWVLQNSAEGVPFDKAVTGDFRIIKR